MWGSEYRIRLHLSRNESHSDEAERTNSIEIEWEFQKLFDGISDDKIETTTLQEFARHQDERMKLNAYMFRDEVVNPIQARGSLGTPPKVSVHNSQSFGDNSLKFGDFS